MNGAVGLPKLARNGPQAMSAIWSLTGGKRTWRLCSPTSEFDPKATWGRGPSARYPLNAISFWCYFHRTLEALDSSRPLQISTGGSGSRLDERPDHWNFLMTTNK